MNIFHGPVFSSISSFDRGYAYVQGSMENLWQGMDNASQPIGEVNYTHGIDIGEPYMSTEQQLNNFPPDVWH